MLEYSDIFFNEVHEFSTEYDFSYHQLLILSSMIQLSGFTYFTQLPNQVGGKILTELPNQVGLQIGTSPYMTEYNNLHHRSEHVLFIK